MIASLLRHRRLLAFLAGAAVVAGVAVAAVTVPGRLVHHQTIDGRILRPSAKLVQLGHFPTGGAVTADGRFYWTVSTGRALNDVRIVALGKKPKVLQTLPLPGASGGIALDSAHRTAYVSGVADSPNTDQQRPGLPGREGDVIHVFTWDAAGAATETGTISVPAPATAGTPQSFPPTNVGQKISWPDRLAISRDGATLLVPLNLADAAAIVDVKTQAVRYVPTGRFPYGAVILPDGKTGLVSNEVPGTVSVIDLAAGTKTVDINAGGHLSHPEGISLSPDGKRAFVAVANTDEVAVIDTAAHKVERMLSVERPQGQGVSPVATAVTPNGRRLLVAEAGGDEIAVFALKVKGVKPFKLIGRIPTAHYPADVQAVKGKLLWIAAKGFGSGANPTGPSPYSTGDNNLIEHPGSAVLTPGYAGAQPFPSDKKIRRLTKVASRDILPAARTRRPADTPLRADGPIKHVFYIVRENRTYDQVLGDDARGDGAPGLTIFGKDVTPNMHALTSRFPLLDHVYANSEASIDGHEWTAAAKVSDYVHKAWQQNYAGRGRPYDFIYAVTWPSTGYLFDQAAKQGISYFNFGEAVGDVVPLFPDQDRDSADQAKSQAVFLNSDVGAPVPGSCYPNDAYVGKNALTQMDVYDTSPPLGAAPGAESRFDCFKQKFAVQTATNAVPEFTYMVLSNDHTEGTTPGRRSPRAMVADNDEGLGKLVDLISHSSIWKSSAIFVIEDDSQDGADHVDAHRMPAAVISPFAKKGAVVHDRYDMLSVIRSMELILGMKPLGLFDSVANPMYDAFAPTAVNADPYSAIPSTYPLLEKNAATAANARLSQRLQVGKRLDETPQHILDKILWQSVHGANSAPPPPGPNAERGG
ncbi:MAG: beta-propeller repeat protein [Solirubrobacterales bacterium]|nr:beta-propeller repeat protein [Solirubrobacterales bacterium]